MELHTYLGIARKRWPVVVLAFLVTVGLTAAFAARRPPVYESRATFVIRPRAVNTENGLRALDTLVRGVEINATYAAIARSDRIRERAEARLEDGKVGGLQVAAEVVTGTNVLEVVVTGPDRQAVQRLAAAVGSETVAYVAELQDIFELAALEAPAVPRNPVGPKRALLVVLGGAVGLALGGLLALVTEGLLRSSRSARRQERVRATLDVIGSEQPRGAFHQELDRALRSNRPFSAAVLKITLDDQAPVRPTDGWTHNLLRWRVGERDEAPVRDAALLHLEAVARERMPQLARDDVMAYLGEGTFALLLPATSARVAEGLVRTWKAAVAVAAARNGHNGVRPQVTTGVFHYSGSDDNSDRAPAAVWPRRG